MANKMLKTQHYRQFIGHAAIMSHNQNQSV